MGVASAEDPSPSGPEEVDSHIVLGVQDTTTNLQILMVDKSVHAESEEESELVFEESSSSPNVVIMMEDCLQRVGNTNSTWFNTTASNSTTSITNANISNGTSSVTLLDSSLQTYRSLQFDAVAVFKGLVTPLQTAYERKVVSTVTSENQLNRLRFDRVQKKFHSLQNTNMSSSSELQQTIHSMEQKLRTLFAQNCVSTSKFVNNVTSDSDFLQALVGSSNSALFAEKKESYNTSNVVNYVLRMTTADTYSANTITNNILEVRVGKFMTLSVLEKDTMDVLFALELKRPVANFAVTTVSVDTLGLVGEL